ncbi:hypothetical protein ACFX13_045773 [Malus domestica]
MAAFLIVLLTSLLALTTLPAAESRLYTNYYQKSCPRFAQIVQDTVTNKQIMNPTTAAATLRLFFHDYLANGCDASILLSSTPFNKAKEKLGVLGIQTGRRGEIRHRCRYQPLIEQRSRNYSYLQLSDVRIQLIFVRNTGSWMEIGNSISHFGIMSAQVVFVLLLFALTNIYTKDIDIGSVDRSSRKAM